MSRFASLSSTTRMRGGSCMARAPSAQELAHFGQQLTRTEGLGDIPVAAGCLGLRLVARKCIGRDGDHWDVLKLGLRLDAARRLVAVKDRKLDVHQDEVRAV